VPDRFAIPDPRPLALTVRDRAPLTPLLARITLGGDDLVGFEHAPGQDVMVAVPTGDATINRRYTIRRADPHVGTLDLDVVVHGDGPGARWARDVAIGSPIAAVGPRGKVVPVGDVDWHLFVCDESGWAATASMVAALDPGELALVVAETAGPEEHQELAGTAEVVLVRCDRGGAAPGDPAALTAAVAALELPAGRGHAYLSAEFAVVRALGADLAARGVGGDQVSPKAYWRRGESNAAHGEPRRES
jgi:NADPH-dependent ferric siderophore reductase